MVSVQINKQTNNLDGLLLRLKAANTGCYIGHFYLGALRYADDLTLLAPTAAAMRSMLTICEAYANEHSMNFNADKSRCILFKPRSTVSHDRPLFFIAGQLIDYTSSWPHLGNIISENEDDFMCIAARRTQLIGQVNSVLSTFGKLNPHTKNNLLYKLCSSLYGSVTWNLLHPETNRVCTSWRVALRRVWHLPPNSHCDIVSALGSNHTLFDELCYRTLKFTMFCLSKHNSNQTVDFVVRNSLFFCRALSPLGRNFLHISQRYSFSPLLICDPSNFITITSHFMNFCTSQFEKVCNPSFYLLVEI